MKGAVAILISMTLLAVSADLTPPKDSRWMKAAPTKGAFTPFRVLKDPYGVGPTRPQVALTKVAKTGGEYDVFRFEWFAEFYPNFCAFNISTNAKDWEFVTYTDCALGWNRGEILRLELPPMLFVRVVGAVDGEWITLPMRSVR